MRRLLSSSSPSCWSLFIVSVTTFPTFTWHWRSWLLLSKTWDIKSQSTVIVCWPHGSGEERPRLPGAIPVAKINWICMLMIRSQNKTVLYPNEVVIWWRFSTQCIQLVHVVQRSKPSGNIRVRVSVIAEAVGNWCITLRSEAESWRGLFIFRVIRGCKLSM